MFPESISSVRPVRSGRGVRIAVIDSGVNPKHPHIVGVAGGLSVRPGGEIEADSYTDVLGHGTAVMAAIQEKAPEAEYYAVQVFHSSLRTTIDCLLNAIDWAIRERLDIVNLSLGTLNPDHAPRFAVLVEKAASSGVLLVAARDSDGQLCLPGSLPGVFGVGLDWEMPRDQYRWECVDSSPVWITSGYPRSLPGVPPRRNLHGISFAVANMTGFIARACEQCAAADVPRSAENVQRALQRNSLTWPPER